MKKLALITIALFLLPLISKAQGTPVHDNANFLQNATEYGKMLAKSAEQISNLKAQYEKMKQQYELARDRVNKLTKVSYAVIDFASADAVLRNFKNLATSIKDCGKAFFENPYVPDEYKNFYRERITKTAQEKDYAFKQLELANQIDGVELTDKDRIDLILRANDEITKVQKKIDFYDNKMIQIVNYIESELAWEKAHKAVKKISFWNPSSLQNK